MYRYLSLSALLFACQPSQPDLEKERAEILELEAAQRDYHFTRNTTDFVNLFSDNFLSINKGVIDHPSKEFSTARFDAYFKSVEFVKWDDNQNPIIRFSDDGSIAYVAVDKEVIVKTSTAQGEIKTDTTNFAWLTIYKKNKGKWEIDCVTSTNKPK